MRGTLSPSTALHDDGRCEWCRDNQCGCKLSPSEVKTISPTLCFDCEHKRVNEEAAKLAEEERQRERAKRQAHRRAHLAHYAANVNIPPRFCGKSWGDFAALEGKAEALEAVRVWATAPAKWGFGLGICGDVGRGKTLLAVIALQEALIREGDQLTWERSCMVRPSVFPL